MDGRDRAQIAWRGRGRSDAAASLPPDDYIPPHERPPLTGLPLLRRRLKAAAAAPVRRALLRYVAGGRPVEDDPAAERRVVILLVSAWGMGGTIRAALNLAGYLAGHYDVEILSIYRRRERPFFGEFPPGVKVTALDDQRRSAAPSGPRRLLERLLRRLPGPLVHRDDAIVAEFRLLSDIRLVRALRGRSGILIGTRPGLNLMIAEMELAGFRKIGQEQMHLRHHRATMREAMVRLYPRLDALTVLTDSDRRRYDEHLGGRLRLVRIPNTVSAPPDRTADMSAKTVLAAGRLAPQKGFDMLIDAWAQIAPVHPDWRLRICGSGQRRAQLEAAIDERGLAEVVELPGAAEDLVGEMSRASIFALSSRFEGFPLTLLEAMSVGLGIASFDCPTGPGDIIDDRRNGLLVPAEDVDGLAAALRELIEDPDLRRRCGAAAVETARAYTMEAVGPQWNALLREVGGRRTTPGPAERAAVGDQAAAAQETRVASA